MTKRDDPGHRQKLSKDAQELHPEERAQQEISDLNREARTEVGALRERVSFLEGEREHRATKSDVTLVEGLLKGRHQILLYLLPILSAILTVLVRNLIGK